MNHGRTDRLTRGGIPNLQFGDAIPRSAQKRLSIGAEPERLDAAWTGVDLPDQFTRFCVPDLDDATVVAGQQSGAIAAPIDSGRPVIACGLDSVRQLRF